jgi:hypothetical protein
MASRKSLPPRPDRPAGVTPVPNEVKRTGLPGKRGSSIAEKAVEQAGLKPRVAGQMTPTGRKGENLVPPALIEIGPSTTKPGRDAPVPEHVHRPARPKDVFIDRTEKRESEKPREKKKG